MLLLYCDWELQMQVRKTEQMHLDFFFLLQTLFKTDFIKHLRIPGVAYDYL